MTSTIPVADRPWAKLSPEARAELLKQRLQFRREEHKAEYEAISAYVCLLRRRAKLTQAQLAARLGINRITVSKWEHQWTFPSLEHRKALRKLEVELDHIATTRMQATGDVVEDVDG